MTPPTVRCIGTLVCRQPPVRSETAAVVLIPVWADRCRIAVARLQGLGQFICPGGADQHDISPVLPVGRLDHRGPPPALVSDAEPRHIFGTKCRGEALPSGPGRTPKRRRVAPPPRPSSPSLQVTGRRARQAEGSTPIRQARRQCNSMADQPFCNKQPNGPDLHRVWQIAKAGTYSACWTSAGVVALPIDLGPSRREAASTSRTWLDCLTGIRLRSG
jgi:hypothetical protein